MFSDLITKQDTDPSRTSNFYIGLNFFIGVFLQYSG